jgi:hypothetical protein
MGLQAELSMLVPSHVMEATLPISFSQIPANIKVPLTN